MKYRVTHLKTGKVDELDAEKVRQIQENGFGALFSFEPIGSEKAPAPGNDDDEPYYADEETPADKPPKGKKTTK